ncbi:hypothetical protein RIF29_13877 [Crotalaria pallida]|uniref:BHLH domain-containing protein n=1 Tax=Crotalaria pallida TaxID=3830 RepID=A0AAN9FAE2_CROPI
MEAYHNNYNYSTCATNGVSSRGGLPSIPSRHSLVLDVEKGELVKSYTERRRNEISEAKALADLKKHSEAERKRRARVNGRLATLRGLVPPTSKVTKDSHALVKGLDGTWIGSYKLMVNPPRFQKEEIEKQREVVAKAHDNDEEPWHGLVFTTPPAILQKASQSYVGELHDYKDVFSIHDNMYREVLISTTFREVINRLIKVCIDGEVFEIHIMEEPLMEFTSILTLEEGVHEREAPVESSDGSKSPVNREDEEVESENSVYSLHERFEEDILESTENVLAKNMEAIMAHSLKMNVTKNLENDSHSSPHTDPLHGGQEEEEVGLCVGHIRILQDAAILANSTPKAGCDG